MIRRLGISGVVAASVAMFISGGCAKGPARVHPPEISASAAGTEAIAKYDANGDGAISGEELNKVPALKEAITEVDKDGDGRITAAEITARIREWQDSRLGLTSMTCQVQMDGRPLADAMVTFVPEEFLGPNVQKATGKTDSNGVATLSIEKPPEPGLTGVAPGFYRVEITKEGATIPPAYNTQTTLGQEVALDAKGMQEGGIRYELKSK